MYYKQLIMGLLLFTFIGPAFAEPNGTGFTYQGELEFQGSPANGVFDFHFEPWLSETDFFSSAPPVIVEDVLVENGIFTVEVDFGPTKFRSQVWLQIGVREGSSTGAFTDLNPRQKVTGTPFVIEERSQKTLSISALALNSPDFVRRVGFGEAYLVSGTPFAWATAPVNLPAGAEILEFGCYVKNADPSGHILAELRRNGIINNAVAVGKMAEIESIDAVNQPDAMLLKTWSITNPIVDNKIFAYYLYVKIHGLQGPDLAVYRCWVRWF